MTARRLLAYLVEAGEPSRKTFHGSLKLRMEVDEGAQLISQPSESDLIFSPTCLELLDTPIGEVHIHSYARLAHGAGKLVSSSLFTQCGRGESGPPDTLGVALIAPPIASARLRRSPSGDPRLHRPAARRAGSSWTYANAASINARCCCR